MSAGPCMCGATDCRSCGPAQGYEVVRRWDARLGRFVWRNPEDGEEPEEEADDVPEADDGTLQRLIDSSVDTLGRAERALRAGQLDAARDLIQSAIGVRT